MIASVVRSTRFFDSIVAWLAALKLLAATSIAILIIKFETARPRTPCASFWLGGVSVSAAEPAGLRGGERASGPGGQAYGQRCAGSGQRGLAVDAGSAGSAGSAAVPRGHDLVGLVASAVLLVITGDPGEPGGFHGGHPVLRLPFARSAAAATATRDYTASLTGPFTFAPPLPVDIRIFNRHDARVGLSSAAGLDAHLEQDRFFRLCLLGVVLVTHDDFGYEDHHQNAEVASKQRQHHDDGRRCA
eukprot:CAMPEP_0170183050 /NCGR_PEP_ID=MMETSP0040_2-20121228/29431_1 /TAXON_ID=641309 /ORGANISM="Lotharella oceanica, Strain CCMP622" /LENGTH=244 /DNA_ID=CAMNT_0010428653 /DNA_START=204 /DNA_END=940 /DNA_ORIENTATION=+